MEVKAMDLMKTLSYQPCFKLVDGTVNIFLYSKNSLAPNSLSVGR